MAFDEEKEVKDLANKKIDLDQYGVWVKKPPRNVEVTSNDQSNDTQEEIIPEEDFNIVPDMEEIDFDTTSLETSPIDDFETIAQEATSDLSALVEFEEQPIEDFFTDTERKVIENDDVEVPVETFIEADFLDDFSSAIIDEKEEIQEEDAPETSVEMDEVSASDTSLISDELSLVPDYEEEEDFNPFPEQHSQSESQIDTELPSDFTEEKLSFIDEQMPIIENFTDAEGNPVIKENNHVEEESVEEEISIDEFLSDNEEISLDEFIDTPVEGKSDILNETPMEMSLTFDDDYEIKTATDPVNQIEETSSIEEIDDFDEMFDNIVDEALPSKEEEVEEVVEQVVEETPEVNEKTEITFDEVNDFDDFLSEFSEPKSSSKAYEPPKEYDLTVTMDEEGTIGSEVTELNQEEELSENITLTTEAPDEKNNKNEETSIDRLQFSDYTDKSYSSDDFDVDKIMSEVEDIGEKTEEVQIQVAQESPDVYQEEQFSEESEENSMEKPEEAMEFNQNEPAEVSRTEEIINSIASEIALLRNEISNLKNDFENFKSGKISLSGDSAINKEPEEKSSGGFFADNNDDDTIALSGDELSNIFNTADFTEESVDVDTQQTDEDSDNGLPSMDFDSEELEEPVIEDNYFEDEDEFPEEIDVPTGVESEETQLFEEIELDEEDQGTEEVFEESEITEDDFQEETYDVTEETVESFEEISEEEITDEVAEPAIDSSEEIFEEEITDEVVEPTIDSFEEISEEEAVEAIEEVPEIVEETTVAEEEISDEPVETVFESSQWAAPIDETMGFAEDVSEESSEGGVFADDPLIIEEPVDTITTAEEELLEELAEIPVEADELAIEPEVITEVEEPVAEEESFEEPEELEVEPEVVVKEEVRTGDIPDDLKQDIKSVLSYMDQLLDNLPEEKIAEFARSEHFELYKKLFTELGL